MNRERTLRVVLVLVGWLFVAGVIPLTIFFSSSSVAAGNDSTTAQSAAVRDGSHDFDFNLRKMENAQPPSEKASRGVT